MAGLSPTHLILFLIVALIVVGPGKLPEVGAAIGKSLREFKRATGDITDNLTGAVNASPTATGKTAPIPPQAPYQSPNQAPYQSPNQAAPYTPQAPYRPQAPYQPVPAAAPYYPPQAFQAPPGTAPVVVEDQPAAGTIVEPPPTTRIG